MDAGAVLSPTLPAGISISTTFCRCYYVLLSLPRLALLVGRSAFRQRTDVLLLFVCEGLLTLSTLPLFTGALASVFAPLLVDLL